MLSDFTQIDLTQLPSPCFVVDEWAVEQNLKVLADVQARSGAKILHALKAFSMFELSPLTNQYLSGTCSSGLHEARLAQEFYQSEESVHGEIHVFAAGFTKSDLSELLKFADHIVFNSPGQIERFGAMCLEAQKIRAELQFGLRINPEHSEGSQAIYNPCAPGSRLGCTRAHLDQYLAKPEFSDLFGELISGLHFHTLCEQGFGPLDRTIDAVFKKFGDLLTGLDWVNFGGGHHITASDYDREALIARIQKLREQTGLQVYLEPGEAVAIGTGVLVTEVLDLTFNQLPQAILDSSATCHMPDTLEMPYRAEILGAGERDEKAHTYRLGGLTCLAGDVMGDYSFDEPLKIGDRIIFSDMSHYTMVKTSTFNGTLLPALALWNSESGELKVVHQFGYEDFKTRLS